MKRTEGGGGGRKGALGGVGIISDTSQKGCRPRGKSVCLSVCQSKPFIYSIISNRAQIEKCNYSSKGGNNF